MLRRIARGLGIERKSILQDLIHQSQLEDPDFGRVGNDDPRLAFAFELRGTPKVPTIREMSEGRGVGEIAAVDDFGETVASVPLEETANAFFFDLLGKSIELETNDPSVALPDLLLGLSRGIMSAMDQGNLPRTRRTKLEQLRMSRFYWGASSAWWTFTHE